MDGLHEEDALMEGAVAQASSQTAEKSVVVGGDRGAGDEMIGEADGDDNGEANWNATGD